MHDCIHAHFILKWLGSHDPLACVTIIIRFLFLLQDYDEFPIKYSILILMKLIGIKGLNEVPLKCTLSSIYHWQQRARNVIQLATLFHYFDVTVTSWNKTTHEQWEWEKQSGNCIIEAKNNRLEILCYDKPKYNAK